MNESIKEEKREKNRRVKQPLLPQESAVKRFDILFLFFILSSSYFQIMTVLDTISKDPQFTGEQKKAVASIERIEKSIGKKWKKKKKFNTTE